MKKDTSALLGMDAKHFLERYWQKQPLLVRNALPGFSSPLTPEELAGLSLEPEVESRIVIENGDRGPWQLLTGPFSDDSFSALPETHWTLLVQGVDLWVDAVHELLSHFDFLPPWRLDDIMVSYAPAGGSVGPHWDSYDVFLLQGLGQRRWQIGNGCDICTATLPGTELRILAGFEAQHSWVLNPGDMLYLPPGISHCGVAENDCMTYSIGFRSPTVAEMLDDLATEIIADDRFAALASRSYRDPPLTPAMANGDIGPAFISQARHLLEQVLADDQALGHWFARYMTRPKHPELEVDPSRDRKARLVTGGADKPVGYRNGECID